MGIFADDWHDCLIEQFKDVVRRDDRATEATLVSVMLEAGFTEDELRDLKLQATMRVDDLQGDFIPDPELAQPPDEPPSEKSQQDEDSDAPQQLSLF